MFLVIWLTLFFYSTQTFFNPWQKNNKKMCSWADDTRATGKRKMADTTVPSILNCLALKLETFFFFFCLMLNFTLADCFPLQCTHSPCICSVYTDHSKNCHWCHQWPAAATLRSSNYAFLDNGCLSESVHAAVTSDLMTYLWARVGLTAAWFNLHPN